MVGVTVQVLATLPAVQLVKFFVMNVLLEPVIVRSESHCTQSDPLPKIASAPFAINPIASLPAASNIGILSSSAAPLDDLTSASLLGTSIAPVSPILVDVALCAFVAISTEPLTVSDAFGVGVPVSAVSHCAVQPL